MKNENKNEKKTREITTSAAKLGTPLGDAKTPTYLP